jgi:nucleotide-binding universal stress UspA family protein
LAKEVGAQLIIINVVKVEELISLVRQMKDAPSPRWDEGLEERLIQHHGRLLDNFAKQQLSQVSTEVNLRKVVKMGEPYKLILDCAQEEKADLIVMSTHGRSGLPRMMLGSVTEKVLRSSSCPVVAIPPHKK